MSEGYSRMLWLEVWNFMGYEHGRIEFDETNIINLKGFNSSGKSTMLVALDVCLQNRYPQKQVRFIMDDKDYFRIMVGFDDGVVILRDKYINGRSLYEMYKYDKCIFTTKQNGQLLKVLDVPEPIAQYVGFVESNGLYLHSRSCFETQLLVETTGRENYLFVNKVCKTEEISLSTELLVSEKNEILSQKNAVETEVDTLKTLVDMDSYLTAEFVDKLEAVDKNLDINESKLSLLGQCQATYEKILNIPDIPELEGLSNDRLNLIHQISNVHAKQKEVLVPPEIHEALDIERLDILNKLNSVSTRLDSMIVPPRVDRTLDLERLSLISSMESLNRRLSGIVYFPELPSVDPERIGILETIQVLVNRLDTLSDSIDSLDKSESTLGVQKTDLETQIQTLSDNYLVCPNCGSLVDKGGGEHCGV